MSTIDRKPIGGVADSSTRSGRCSILIAEDCPDTVQLLQAYLAGPRVALTTARNGREALEAFQSGYFDMVLLDIGLPDIDGYIVAREIRRWEAANGMPRTPVAALTAASDFDSSSRILSAGCTLHLIKPINRQTLLQIVSQYGSQTKPPATRVPLRSVPAAGPDTLDLEASISEAVKALIPEYLTHLNQHLSEMTIAVDGLDYGSIRISAHKIKGSGGAFGFPKISEYAREIERAAAKGNAPAIGQLVLQLHHYVDNASAEWSFAAGR